MRKLLFWISTPVFIVLFSILGINAFATPASALQQPASSQPVTVSQQQRAPLDFSPTQVTQIQKIIHDYLVSNPQVLVEASQTLQTQQEAKMESDAVSTIKQNKNALFEDSQSPSVGSKDAPVTLVEFFDYQCGHCKTMAPTLEKLITEDHQLNVIFKELPIFGGMSEYAAKAALAAEKQPGKYYQFHNALFATTEPLTKTSVINIAQKSGINISELKKDMLHPDIEKQIRGNFQLAQSLKIIGTPTFVITNKAQTKFRYIPGALSLQNLKSELEAVQQ